MQTWQSIFRSADDGRPEEPQSSASRLEENAAILRFAQNDGGGVGILL
jgi:hypothetical protein